MIKVVCGIISKDNRILLCRRSSNKSLSGFWEFPGGKNEIGESEIETLVRELDEELGIKVSIETHFTNNNHSYTNFEIELIAYKCEYLSGKINLIDHDNFVWTKIDELLNYKLAPADIPIAEKLILEFENNL